jgi:hypothetical protein
VRKGKTSEKCACSCTPSPSAAGREKSANVLPNTTTCIEALPVAKSEGFNQKYMSLEEATFTMKIAKNSSKI